MRITPLDIRKQEFRKTMRGLDAEEVYAFLSTVGDEYEAILNDNKALRERVLELDDKVQEYRTLERTLRDTLITAERVTVEAKDNARREANLIIKEAQLEAERALRDIKSEAMKLRQEVSQLRSQRESYLGRMKVIAESLLKFIEGAEVDFYEEDDAYQAQLPDESTIARASTLADPSAATGNLFNAAEPAADQSPRVTPGVPSDLRDPVAAKPPLPPVPPVRVAPPVEPREAREPRGVHEPRNEGNTQETLADINSIIERMADGQKELLGHWPGEVPEGGAVPAQSPQGEAGEVPRGNEVPRGGAVPVGHDRSSEPAQFEPIPSSPIGTMVSEPHLDEPPRALEATTDDPTPAQGLPLGQLESKSPNGPEITSEISLDQIRRDLERRMSQEKKGN